MTRPVFSFMGLVVGILSFVLLFTGEDIAKSIYPAPPPPALLTRKDMTPLAEGEIKDAVVDFAAEVTAESSRKIAAATAETGRKTARRIWDTVKGWTGGDGEDSEESSSVPQPEAVAAPETSGEKTDEKDGANGVADLAPSGSEEAAEAATAGLRWRDVKINLIDPGSPDQKWLVGIFEKSILLGGLAALVLAMAGWIRRENQRMCICAGIVGLLAMAWAYVMATIAVVIVGAILGPFINP